VADAACSNSTLINGTSECIAWTSNGTALFGGPYATGLILGHRYFISLGWVKQNDSSTRGLANSSSFDLVNAVVTSTVTASPSATALPSTTGYASSQTAAAMLSSNSSMTTGAIVGIALDSTAIALAVAGSLFTLWRRSQSKRDAKTINSSSTHSLDPDRSSGTSAPTMSTRVSMSQNNLNKVEDFFKQRDSTYGFKGELAAETPIRQQPHELDSTPFEGVPVELDSSIAAGSSENSNANKHTSVSDAFGGLVALLAPRKRASSSFGGSMLLGSGGGNGGSDGSVSAGTREQGLVTDKDMTPAQLYALEEEERRIDDAIRENERLVELKVQRASVQVRINAARMSGIAGAP
jgi:hypothetical protein